MNTINGDYLLGSDPAVLARLDHQGRLPAPATWRSLLPTSLGRLVG